MTGQKNILLVSSKYMPEYSGSGFRAHKLYKRLCVADPEISPTVLCGSVSENKCLDYEYDGFKIHRIASKPENLSDCCFLGSRLSEMRSFASENGKTRDFLVGLGRKPDLVHIFGRNFVTASAAVYARENNIPLIVELCNEMEYPHQYIPFPNRLFMDCSLPERHFFVCISETLKKVCLRAGIREENIWCRPNPVDENRFRPVEPSRKYELRKRLSGFGEDSKLVVYIAKFRRSKNHIFLLDVLKNLPKEFVLYMKGPLVDAGPLSSEDQEVFKSIQDRISELGLEGRVRLESGFCETIEEFYQMADVYAFPSLSEGLGTPVLEVIASGVPIVANRDLDVSRNYVKDGRNGNVSEMDPANFADKIVGSLSIGRDMLKLASSEIMAEAGTSVIDRGYLNMIGRMTG